MKKQLPLTLLFFCIFSLAKAQWVSIPDSNFGKWLTANYTSCMQGNPQIGFEMDTSCGLLLNVGTVDISYLSIQDVYGVQYFKNINTFNCSFNKIDSLSHIGFPNSLLNLYCQNNKISQLCALPQGLRILNCKNNKLNQLPVLPTSLITLNCSINNLSIIPPIYNNLYELDCSYNTLAILPILPSSLNSIICYNNLLTQLPTLPPSLYGLYCDANRLTSLPTLPVNLVVLSTSNNQISNLPSLPNTLKILYCNSNNLTIIGNLPTSLEQLNCNSNQLTSLPSLPNNLVELQCRQNQISSINLLPNKLWKFVCNNNQISCLPLLPKLSTFYFANNQIDCLPNKIFSSSYDIDPATFQLCGPASGCDFYYNISGDAHQKNQNTCIADSLSPDVGLMNIKIVLKNQLGQIEQQTYTSKKGLYSFASDTFKSYNINMDTTSLPFLVECPSTFSHTANLTVTDTITSNKNFGLSCNNNVDFISASVFADRFRPAFNTYLHIAAGEHTKLRYNANCGKASSGTVTTTFSGPVKYVSPSPNALTPSISGNTLTYSLANLDSLKIGDLDVVLSTDSFATIGSQVCITTIIHADSIDANPSNDTLKMCFSVVNSYDPNDKAVYPKQISQDGGWLTYTVQFQNTGNDTAYTVVVRDTLPQELEVETFQYLASSHKNVIQLKGREAVFTFPKINLVDSATNEHLSKGWIQFKVKTKPNLPPTPSIANRVAIYFDFNSPIYTNYAITTQPTGIKNISDFAFSVYPNPTNSKLNIAVSDVNPVDAILVDMMGRDILRQNFTQKTTLDIASFSAGVYYLKITKSEGQPGVRKIVKN